MDDIKIFSWAGLIVLIIIVITLGLVLGLGGLIEYNICDTLQTISPDYQFQWVFWGGCRVLVGGFWMHYDDVNLIQLKELR